MWIPFKNSFKYECFFKFLLLNQSSSVILESQITPFSFLSESLKISYISRSTDDFEELSKLVDSVPIIDYYYFEVEVDAEFEFY